MKAVTQRSLNTEITEALICTLIDNVQWQTNLTDEEREQCLRWATLRISQAVAQARTTTIAQLRLVNELLGRGEITRTEVIKAVLGTE